MRKVVVMRGLSGAGKSTFVRTHYPTATIASADLFFSKDGEYKFDFKLLQKAHDYCFEQFRQALHRGDEIVVVDNTNITLREFKHYIEHAKQMGYEVEVNRLVVDPAVAASRNLHGVPLESILKRQKLFVEFPGENVFIDGVKQ